MLILECLSVSLSISQNKMFNKLKHELEDWREPILLIDSLLKWQRKAYAGVLFGVINIVFLVIWWMDLSVLTMAALTGLAITMLDYGWPIVSKFVFKPENWTGVQEKSFEGVCTELLNVWMQVRSVYDCFFNHRETKSTKVNSKI